MFVSTYSVTVTTDASGNASVDTPPIRGIINRIEYVKDDYATGVDFTITVKDGPNIWAQDNVDASATKYPVIEGSDVDGTAETGSFASIAVGDEPINIAIAAGGNATSGTFKFTIVGTVGE